MTKKKAKTQDEKENQQDDIELKPIKSSEISTSSKLIKKYGVDPVKTSGILSFNAYRKIIGYGLRYANEDIS